MRFTLAFAAIGWAGLAQAFPVERCVNLSNFLEVPRSDAWVYNFDAAHIDAIAQAGFDTIRLPLNVADWWRDGRIDPRFRHIMLDVVERAREADLFVIVDLHHFDALMEDPEGLANRFVGIWVALAEAFEGQDGITFELLNEPTDQVTTAQMLPLYARALASIRKRHPQAWVIIGGADWNALDRLQDLPHSDDPFVVHTFHYYDPFPFTHQQAEWTHEFFPESSWGTADERAKVGADIARAATHHTPVFLGEFGVHNPAPGESRLAWIEAVRRAAESHEIPWCHWGFGAAFRLYDTDEDVWLPGARDALFTE